MIIEVFPPKVVGILKPSITFGLFGSLAPTLPPSSLHPRGGGDPHTYIGHWEQAGSELGESWSELEQAGSELERAGRLE